MFLILLLKTNPCNFSRRVFMPNEGAHFETVNGNAQMNQVGGNMIGDNVAGNKTVKQKFTSVFRGDRMQVKQHKRQRMLERMERYCKGLQKSVHQEMLIKLGKQEQMDDVPPWDRQVQEDIESIPHTIPKETPIIEIFDEMEQALLILGAPGSGKTMTLLELAQDTIARAKNDPTQPIPVRLNLASWSERKQRLDQWVIDELNLKHQIPSKDTKRWLKNNELLLLLDGLDEVMQDHRKACVDAINLFRQQQGFAAIAVCSRTQEYRNLTSKLKLRGAILIQPLTLEQIDSYLTNGGEALSALRSVIQKDMVLQKLAESPLMLSIMAIVYRGKSIEKIQTSTTSLEENSKQLFALYIDRMLKRRTERLNGDNVVFLYPQQQIEHWLAWLAAEMTQHGQTEFFIEQIQPTWLSSHLERLLYDFIIRVFIGIILLFAIGIAGFLASIASGIPVIGLGDSIIVFLLSFILMSILAIKFPRSISLIVTLGLTILVCVTLFEQPWIPCLFDGLLLGVPGGFAGMAIADRNKIKIAESLHWSWNRAIIGGLIGFIGGIFIGEIIDLASQYTWRDAVLEITLPIGVFAILILGLTRKETIDQRTSPNQGIRQSAKNAVLAIVIPIFLLVLYGVFSDVFADNEERFENLFFAFLDSVPIGIGASLWIGGAACIQHFVLRALLSFKCQIPWRLSRFLDYAEERILLRKIGGGYTFIHTLLLNYFANMDNQRSPKQKDG